MIRLINTFQKPNFSEYYNKELMPLIQMGEFKKINIFIGGNNSGKSRMMRKIALNSTDWISDTKKMNDSEFSNFKGLLGSVQNILGDFGNYNYSSISNMREYDVNNTVEFMSSLDDYKKNNPSVTDRQLQYINDIIFRTTNIDKYKNYTYIPLLRGVENFDFGKRDRLDDIKMTRSEHEELDSFIDNSKIIYKKKTFKVYHIPEENIFTAEEIHKELKSKLLGELNLRNSVLEFQNFISKNFYLGEDFVIIPKESGYVDVKIGKGHDRSLHNLGDGIKQIIILLYKIFELRNKEHVFFIEEPEINLHPGLQRKFIEILSSNEFAKHQFFLTTHSNHIIDQYNNISDDIAIFKFSNCDIEKFKIERINDRSSELLEELGVKSTSVFISNCTIWVEGISDRIYIKKYLELYLKQKGEENRYREDIHYSFIEYQGTNLVHYNFDSSQNQDNIFVKSLSNQIMLVMDNDFPTKGYQKEKNQRALKSMLKDKCIILESREIENLIKFEVLYEFLKKDNTKKEVIYTGKIESSEAYQGKNKKVKLHEFIKENFTNIKNYSSTYSLKDKMGFSKGITKLMSSYEDLTEEAKTLTETIYNFIKESNK